MVFNCFPAIGFTYIHIIVVHNSTVLFKQKSFPHFRQARKRRRDKERWRTLLKMSWIFSHSSMTLLNG